MLYSVNHVPVFVSWSAVCDLHALHTLHALEDQKLLSESALICIAAGCYTGSPAPNVMTLWIEQCGGDSSVHTDPSCSESRKYRKEELFDI